MMPPNELPHDARDRLASERMRRRLPTLQGPADSAIRDRSVGVLIASHPNFNDRSSVLVRDLFRSRTRVGAERALVLHDAIDVLAAATKAALAEPSDVDLDRFFIATAGIAFGSDLESIEIKARLLGRPPAPFPIPRPPVEPPRIDLGQLPDTHCIAGIAKALAGAAGKGRGAMGQTYIDGITGLDNPACCAGEILTIEGEFPEQPAPRTHVTFTGVDGGAVLADVQSWTDTAVRVTVPADARIGPVGFYEAPDPAKVLDAAQGLQNIATEVAGCFPTMEQHVNHAFAGIKLGPTTAPPSAPGDVNLFRGGPPVVLAFTVNGRTHTSVPPGSWLNFAWATRNATEVRVVSQNNTPGFPGTMTVAPPMPSDYGSYSAGPLARGADQSENYRIEASNDCGVSTEDSWVKVDRVSKVAVVLSGGGAKGCFQVGALQYLYKHLGVQPDLLVGTSVGAINAVKLAEGDGEVAAIDRLTNIWKLLQGDANMWLEEKWFADTNEALKEAFYEGAVGSDGGVPWYLDVLSALNPITAAMRLAFNAYIGYKKKDVLYDFVMDLLEHRSFLNLNPIRSLMEQRHFLNPDKVIASGIQLLLVAVSLESGDTILINNDGDVHAVKSYPGPGERSVRAPLGKADLVDAVIASASIPVIFPPVRISGHHCVDGGAREVIPLRYAVEEGSHTIYAIHCGVDLEHWDPNVTLGGVAVPMLNIAKIGGRAITGIMLDEVSDNDLHPPNGYGPVDVHVIRPSVQVNDTTEISPGLIDINIDYGWMRACDVTNNYTFTQHQYADLTADALTRRRIEAHVAEGGYLVMRNRGTLSLLRQSKQAVRDAALARVREGFLLPEGSAKWWQDWSRWPRAMNVPDVSPWELSPATDAPPSL